MTGLSGPPRRDPRDAPARHRDGHPVAGRSLGGPKDQDHPPPGAGRGRPRRTGQRTGCIYGATCPAEGKGAGLVIPRCDTEAVTAHLAGISAMAAPAAHAVVILDQAGWHMSTALAVPDNITPLPPRSLRLNPVDNAWQHLRKTLPTASSATTRTSSPSAATPGPSISTGRRPARSKVALHRLEPTRHPCWPAHP